MKSHLRRRSLSARCELLMEALEARVLLSGIPHLGILKSLQGTYLSRFPQLPSSLTPLISITSATAKTSYVAIPHNGTANPLYDSPPAGSFTPSQMRHAYGLDQVMFGSIVGDGTGQTIAIVDAYDYPTAWEDLQAFDTYFGLPDPPSFQRVNQTGSTSSYPATDSHWSLESALDIQWAHAMAPGANIILVEANDNNYSNLISAGVNWARNQPGVSVVSMSFGSNEFFNESAFDSFFTTPAGHSGITFNASTGDTGQPAGYPSYSPNVVAVGGTSLYLNGTDYGSESGWSSGGGGISAYINQPSFQSGIVTQSSNKRTAPDLALDADPNTGVPVFNSFAGGSPGGGNWFYIGGTSLASPLFAGMMAVVNQGRLAYGQPTLNGAAETLPRLYAMQASNFHDITTGNNGSAAGVGYDLVTGRGSPAGPQFIYGLVNAGSLAGKAFQDNNSNGAQDPGEQSIAGANVYLDFNNNGIWDQTGGGTFSQNTPKNIPDSNSVGAVSMLAVPAVGGPITDLNVTLNIAHLRDSDLTVYLTGPDNTRIQLFSGVGGSGANFAGTTLDDQASTSITLGTAPFSGSFKPSPDQLAVFNGKSAQGVWTLNVVDNRFQRSGTLNSWSLSFTTGPEPSTVTGADGSYTFNNLAGGTYNVRAAATNYVGTAPLAGAHVTNVIGTITGDDFGFFPKAISTAGPNDGFYLWMDPTHTNALISTGAGAGAQNPAYVVPLLTLPTLRLNLAGSANSLTIDFVNGSPLPTGGLTVDGGGFAGSEVRIHGGTQNFDLGDTFVALVGGGGGGGGSVINYQNLATLTLYDMAVQVSGSLSTVQTINLNQGAHFNWA